MIRQSERMGIKKRLLHSEYCRQLVLESFNVWLIWGDTMVSNNTPTPGKSRNPGSTTMTSMELPPLSLSYCCHSPNYIVNPAHPYLPRIPLIFLHEQGIITSPEPSLIFLKCSSNSRVVQAKPPSSTNLHPHHGRKLQEPRYSHRD
jgi:hypothetical protein